MGKQKINDGKNRDKRLSILLLICVQYDDVCMEEEDYIDIRGRSKKE